MQKPDPSGPSDLITLSSSTASVSLYLFGAHITSYTVNGQERLWMSSLVVLDGTKPIRGGVPIAFPQFADEGDLKLHGFARESLWSVGSLEPTKAVLTLAPNTASKEMWDNEFELVYTVELQDSGSLLLNMRVKNTSESSAFSFTACFHTYFLFQETNTVELSGGLGGKTYIDKCDGRKKKEQGDGPIVIPAEATRSGRDAGKEGYVDRIYTNSGQSFVFARSGVELYNVTQSPSWPDTTLYNPWLGDKQGPVIGPDFDDDGYKKMICLEPTISKENAVVLNRGEVWEGSQTIEVGDF
ncbi:hypothetical protein TrVE_jg13303 [Triparma verrucosa]|uniref:glucose-6-phosphate 1-epimerase n=1 Tax=Triparma verrucosa TaxID=1606542 RepID=A0A9W7CKL0_9STRA|nr:hypothetical protein TrVE_jg13303 [Triparma verrucosa]